MDKITLEPGMTIYGQNRFSGMVRCTINRVTKTQAIAEAGRVSIRFNREVIPTHFYARGSDCYTKTSWAIETPELKEAHQRHKLLSKIEAVDFSEFTTEKLRHVCNIIAEQTSG